MLSNSISDIVKNSTTNYYSFIYLTDCIFYYPNINIIDQEKNTTLYYNHSFQRALSSDGTKISLFDTQHNQALLDVLYTMSYSKRLVDSWRYPSNPKVLIEYHPWRWRTPNQYEISILSRLHLFLLFITIVYPFQSRYNRF